MLEVTACQAGFALARKLLVVGLLRKVPGRGVVVTSRASTAPYDIISRYFAPWVGVDEDPVTGSVHCCLGPYWSKQLKKRDLIAYQSSARGGVIYLRLADNRIHLGGRAVTVSGGELYA